MTTIVSRWAIFAMWLAMALPLTGVAWTQNSPQVIYGFPASGTNGINPEAKLLYASGRLYGTTHNGGRGVCAFNNACGVVFALTPNTSGVWTYHSLYAFHDGNDAQTPVGNLVLDSRGNVYGATEYGGAHGLGAVYKLTPGTGGEWTESIIHSFGGTPDGSTPTSGLTMDAAGNLYGTTQLGGASGLGTVYKLTGNSNGSWSESTLYSFGGSPDGSAPSAEVIFDPAGNIYGTTETGGVDAGTVFELSPESGGQWTESILYTFPNVQIGYPVAPLWMDAAGNLYGTGQSDGGDGSVYELTPASGGGWTEATLFSFLGGIFGGEPRGGLAPDTKGNLYGTTFGGGEYRYGTIFKMTPGAEGKWTESVSYSFRVVSDGDYPEAGLTPGELGTFYGTASFGGTGSENGLVFQFKP